MSDPTRCQPPDPTVSGWWYLAKVEYDDPEELHEFWNAGGGNGGWWDDFTTDGMTAEQAGEIGYTIIAPIPTFAEVEALREDRHALGDAVAEIAILRAQLTAANAEIARLKLEAEATDVALEERNKSLRAVLDRQAGVLNPDLVTVRREVMALRVKPTRKQIDAAAIQWCGQKDRETDMYDILYFRENWWALPGLRIFVDQETNPSPPPEPKQ